MTATDMETIQQAGCTICSLTTRLNGLMKTETDLVTIKMEPMQIHISTTSTMMVTTIRLTRCQSWRAPGDFDNDGVLDVNDLFPEDSVNGLTTDGDGEGDNADADDDNDGWADTDESEAWY